MRARGIVFAGVCATYLVIACATGGTELSPEGGVEGDGPAGAMDHHGQPSDSPMSYPDVPSDDDSGMTDDSPAPFDSAPGDTFIPPTDTSMGMDMKSPPDSPPPPKDVVTTTPKCSFTVKHAFEVTVAEDDEAGVPCTGGCAAGDCCAHFASPPICIKN